MCVCLRSGKVGRGGGWGWNEYRRSVVISSTQHTVQHRGCWRCIQPWNRLRPLYVISHMYLYLTTDVNCWAFRLIAIVFHPTQSVFCGYLINCARVKGAGTLPKHHALEMWQEAGMCVCTRFVFAAVLPACVWTEEIKCETEWRERPGLAGNQKSTVVPRTYYYVSDI